MTPADPRTQALKRVGQTLNNKWTIDRLVDVGGMAAVYAATHRNGKKVAIKMLHPFIAAHEDVRERFLREGYVANQVDHPGAVSVLDDDMTPDGAPFLVMELLDGESLDHWLARVGGTLPLPDVLAVADQVLDVLHAFHARGVIHRDIKPGNLYITRQGLVKVLDFGLARLRDPRFNGAPTATGIVLGTAAYMPPEQAQGKTDQIDIRSDVFAVGAVMFRALAGRAVHDAKAPTERLFQAMKDRAISLGVVVPQMPTWVVGIVDKALAFDKKERWATADDMRKAVRTTFAQLREEAHRVRAPLGSTPPEHDASMEVSEIFDAILEPSIVVDVSFGDTKVSNV
ncbi:Serine/threonine protein kinase PknB [Labilithrix luteola]|uniref:Serine/threonine protein kinase PknB n=1 Tax=Labilithrix luteola TaxID=1391654 RepID=A0A0K1PME1_9BACT|nr:serine/threonine-protein kinase [Labilithrix luteola]AKU94259.1 Serine/threonine protein kinase PknB [Labilithrix luteola]